MQSTLALAQVTELATAAQDSPPKYFALADGTIANYGPFPVTMDAGRGATRRR